MKNFLEIKSHMNLTKQLAKREIISRYRGSYLGFLWPIISPLLLLIVYTFVFSEIFKSKWGSGNEDKMLFALVLFCGIAAFNVFSEVVTRAPSLILVNVNYVKKVIFPLQILPIVTLYAAFFNFLINIVILLISLKLIVGVFNWTVIFIPIVIAPLIFLSLGLGWLFSSIGVYFRDFNHILSIGVQALMFLTPIFYPVSIIPDRFKVFYNYNPISYVVEDLRKVIIWGQFPSFYSLIINTIVGLIVALFGYYIFKKIRGGFADVL